MYKPTCEGVRDVEGAWGEDGFGGLAARNIFPWEQIEWVSFSSALVLLLSIILPCPLRPAGLRRFLVPMTTPHSPSGLWSHFVLPYLCSKSNVVIGWTNSFISQIIVVLLLCAKYCARNSVENKTDTVPVIGERRREGKNPVGFIEYIVSSYRGGGEGKERFFL